MRNTEEVYEAVKFRDYSPYKIKERDGILTIVGIKATPRRYILVHDIINSELINDFVTLDLSNEDEILNFCNKYGLPGDHGRYSRDMYSKKLRRFSRFFINQFMQYNTIIPVIFLPGGVLNHILLPPFIKNDEEILWAFKHPKMLEGVLNQSLQGFKCDVKEIKELIHDLQAFNEVDDEGNEEIITLRKKSLSSIISYLIRGVEIKLIFNDGKLYTQYWIKNLKQALGVYFYELILSKTPLKRCKNPKCSKFFTPTKDGQKYCPRKTDNLEKRSPCEKKHSQSKYRKRKKIKKAFKNVGLDIDQFKDNHTELYFTYIEGKEKKGLEDIITIAKRDRNTHESLQALRLLSQAYPTYEGGYQ